MPSVARPGKVGKYVELPADLAAEFSALADRMGDNFTGQLVLAMRRHLAYPPTKPELPALPDATPKGRKKNPKKSPQSF